MKNIVYYLLLLIAIALVTGFLLAGGETMSMVKVFSLCGSLALYTVAISLVGEGKAEDERALHHRYLANRAGLIAGTASLAIAVMFQLLVNHRLDYWLLAALITINLTKIISLIWLNYKR